MELGYIIGCFISILLWKIDRSKIFYLLNKLMNKLFNNKVVIQIAYIIIITSICWILSKIRNNLVYNAVTAFLIIDISNTENKNLAKREKVHFYDSISTISRALICGFTAPLLYVLILGNIAGVIYALIYNIHFNNKLPVFHFLFTVFTVVPAFITEILLYLVYVLRNKNFFMDFKGDYIINAFTKPLLNADIMAAYIEAVNFYYYFNKKDTDYIKSYGDYKNKIDETCIKDYLSIIYGICMIIFIIFFILFRLSLQ